MTYVPEDIEVRRNALALHKAMREAEKALPSRWEPNETRDAELQALDDEYERKKAEVFARYSVSPEAEAAAAAARAAYTEAPGGTIYETYNGDAVICALSGAPIWEDDEIVEDHETNETFLRAAVGLPPRPAVAEEDEEELEEAA